MLTLADLNLDVLHLIAQELCNEGIEQALILSRVSKSFNIVATRFLYRSVTYRAYPDTDSKKTDFDLLQRLLGDRILRSYVRSFTVAGSSRRLFEPEDYVKKVEPIVGLVSMLPQLQTFTWATRARPPEGLGCALQGHNSRPQFHLSLLDCRAVSPDLLDKECLASLDASVRLVGNRRTRNNTPPILEIQKVFFQSPNLRSFSLVALNPHGGRLPRSYPDHVATNFRLSGEEKFPPLEELMLDGYCMGASEWTLWRSKVDWSRLTSLTLEGEATRNLRLMQGVVKYLKVLRLHSVGFLNSDYVIRNFLRSFRTLEEITLDGFFASADALVSHPALESIAMHKTGFDIFTNWGLFFAGGMRDFAFWCPLIKDLDLELYGNIERSHDAISAFAGNFPNLLHLHLRIRCWNYPRKPIPMYKAMDTLAETFFRIRGNRGPGALDLVRFISLSLTMGKETRTYDGPPPS